MSTAKKDYDLRLKWLRRQVSASHISNADNKSKAIWQVINRERRNNSHTFSQAQLDIDGESTTDPLKIANHLNQYFTTIADQTLNTQPRTTLINLHEPLTMINHTLEHFPLTNEQEILTIINNLKPKTSTGLDDISARMLKHCKEALTPPLVKITNLSLSQGHVPSALKQAKVYPKHKGGTHKADSNYRPISLIPTFSKIIEKVVLKRLIDHCEHHHLITEGQHGFIKGRSTTTALIKFAEFIIDNLEAKKPVTTIMLDFSKAFDCLGHDLILDKLEDLGIKGRAKMWFNSYLQDRSQVVEVQYTNKGITQEARSMPLPVNRGVPQGSVLGPVLFILFTNDMPQYLRTHCTPLMYADDTTLLLSEKTNDNLAIDSYIALNMAYQYCHENDLVVNTAKTKQLTFGRRQNEVLELPDVVVENHARFLGMTIDDKISWNEHVNSLSKKLNSSLYVLKRIRHVSDNITTKIAYHALFETHIKYGLVVWGGTSAGNLSQILLLQ
uniref:Reverse transcriptase domain-containing protein n=2 Tax=Graphocephala atropunctata TaxID=36148 RepID=A0A1B6M0X3_9HEMI